MRSKTQMIARINDKYSDFHLKVGLVRLVEVIRKDFKGCVSSENKLSIVMKERYGWGNKTTRKRLDQLRSIGLIKLNRTGARKRKKEYRFVDV